MSDSDAIPTLPPSSVVSSIGVDSSKPGEGGSKFRHVLCCQVPRKGKWQRRHEWWNESVRELKDWEWRILIHLKALPLYRQKELILEIAQEAAVNIIPSGIEDPLRQNAIDAIVEQAKKDSEQ